MVDGNGVPLSSQISGANVHDVSRLVPTVARCPLPGYGEKKRLPRRLYADRAYDSADHESLLRWIGIEPVFAQRGQAHGSGLGRYRYVVEQTIAAVHQNRRLKVRYEKRPELHQAFLTLACAKICWYRLDSRRN